MRVGHFGNLSLIESPPEMGTKLGLYVWNHRCRTFPSPHLPSWKPPSPPHSPVPACSIPPPLQLFNQFPARNTEFPAPPPRPMAHSVKARAGQATLCSSSKRVEHLKERRGAHSDWCMGHRLGRWEKGTHGATHSKPQQTSISSLHTNQW